MHTPFFRPLAAAALLGLAVSGAQAIGVTDAQGDFLAGYAGAQAGDLDVIGASVTYNASADSFVFSGTMDDDIGTTASGFYVWGVNRGGGTARFAADGIDNVPFDAVVILRPGGQSVVTLLAPAAPVTTNLAASQVVWLGSTLLGQVSGALLPGNGFAKADYTFNLWPRDGAAPAGFGQISDFAPDNANFHATVVGAVPEPASVALFALGLSALLFARRRAAR